MTSECFRGALGEIDENLHRPGCQVTWLLIRTDYAPIQRFDSEGTEFKSMRKVIDHLTAETPVPENFCTRSIFVNSDIYLKLRRSRTPILHEAQMTGGVF